MGRLFRNSLGILGLITYGFNAQASMNENAGLFPPTVGASYNEIVCEYKNPAYGLNFKNAGLFPPTVGASYNEIVCEYKNPAYDLKFKAELKMGVFAEEKVMLVNGSPIIFSSRDTAGKIIRTFCENNDVENPLGASHAGLLVFEDPRILFNLILEKMPDEVVSEKNAQISREVGKPMINELIDNYSSILKLTSKQKEIKLFCLEADGSADEVIQGIYPHVHLHTFDKKVNEYNGNIYVRNLFRPMQPWQSFHIVSNYLGRQYEGISTSKELIRSVNDKNIEENTDRLFCSEMVGAGLKDVSYLDKSINVSNITPEDLSSHANKSDVLREIARVETPIKVIHNFKKKKRKNIGGIIAHAVIGLFQ